MRWTLILGFANKPTADRTLELFETTRTIDSRVVILDNHYPTSLNPPDWAEWANRLGGDYLDAGRNLGLHNGLNWMLQQLGATGNDQIVGLDPDTMPITTGWDSALFSALRLPKVGWASLMNPISEGEMKTRGFEVSFEEGLHLQTTLRPVVNSICAFNLAWVLESGGFQEPTEYYGGVESCMWPHLQAKKQRWVFLQDFREGKFDVDLSDEAYRQYKWRHAHEGMKGSFDEFLETKA